MSRSRKNSGIIGRLNNPEPSSKSGVWSVDDSYLINGPEKQSLKRTQSQRLQENALMDKFGPFVPLQISDIHYDDHILKDKSDYGWDEYYAAVSNTRPASYVAYHGPRYRDWCTKFYENSSYYVADTAAQRFGTGAFTLEFWVKLERYDSTEYYILSKGSLAGRTSGGTGWTVYVSTTRTLGFYDGLSNVSIATTSVLTMDQWYHVAIVRTSTSTNDTKIYLDGALAATGTSTGNFTDTSILRIGSDRIATTTTCFSGRITDIRLNNNAVYSGAFTRPSAALTMTGGNTVFSHSMLKPHHDTIPVNHAQGATITMGNTNTSNIERMLDSPFFVPYPKLTGHGSHSVYNYSTIGSYKIYEGGPNATALRFGTSAFTVECWVKPAQTGISSVMAIAGKGTGNAGAGTGWTFRISTSGFLTWDDGTASPAQTSGGAVTAGGWYHVAAVREGTGTNQFKMYLNGALVYTGTVSTNYTDTTELRIFNSKQDQYTFNGYACGLRISMAAKYTSAFDIESTTFIDNSMSTTFNETLLLVGTTGTKPPRPPMPAAVNVGYNGLAAVKRSNEWGGGKGPYSRTGSSWSCFQGGQATKIVAVEGNSSFQFGTGDFSLELWFQSKYNYDAATTRRTILDTRSAWTDTGFSIDISPIGRGISVQSNSQVVLHDTYTRLENGFWYHICLQRVNGKLALYVDGTKVQERAYTTSMSSGAAKITFFNQTYTFTQNWSTPSFFSDVRILKGSAAYAVNGVNPPSFILPTSPVPEITNTVFLLSANSAILKDSATGSTNVVTAGGRNETNFTSAWNAYPSSYGPYLNVGKDNRDTAIVCDTTGGTTDGHAGRGHNSGTSTRTNYAWITHLVKPWTIEFWMHPNQVDPAVNSGGQYNFGTATAAGQEGFQIVSHQNGSRTNSWGNWNFSIWTAHNSGVQTIGTSSTTDPALKPHSWNHLAVVFDPTKTNKLALWANGVRVANSTGFTTPGQKTWHTDDLTLNNYMSNPRISDVARYNNDTTTYTIPTENWTVDANTVYQATWDGPLTNLADDTIPLVYGGSISYKNKKFGIGSWKFSNKESAWVDRFGLTKGAFNTMQFSNWYGDFTIEFWAQWWDATAGGKAPFATYGNVIFHYANNMTIGINPSGVWQFKSQSSGGTTPTVNQTLTTSVTAATTTSQTWDHIVFTRRQGNFYFYINGVYQGMMVQADYGTPTGLAANYSTSYADTITDTQVGVDNAITNASTGWTGFIQDIRFTNLARYDTDGANNMVHVGTTTSALPKNILPSPANTVTSIVGSMFLYGISTGEISRPYYYTESNSNLTLDGDWTIECFVKKNTAYNANSGGGQRDVIVGSLNGDWALHFGNYSYQSAITFFANAWNTGSQNFGAYDSCITNTGGFSDRNQQWYHVALTRSGTTLTLYINGVATGTSTIPSISGVSGSSQTQWKINNTVNGHVSSIRFTKSVVYTGNFTPPTSALTSLANTQLLIHPFTADRQVIDYGPNNIPILYSTGTNRDITVSASGPFGTIVQPYLP